MANYSFLLFLCAYFITKSLASSANDANRNLHIVYMGSLPKENYSPKSHHLSMLQQTINHNDAKNHMVRSYHKSFNGFAAMITDQEREKLKEMEGVVSVFPSKTLKLHTTRSWDFMGLTESVHRNNAFETDLIIGVIDTGIWPESESFNDYGFGPIPEKWRGACEGGENFTCNNKLIGARYYVQGQPSARDIVGHGSHTASIAAGNRVVGASFYGVAEGVAKGGVPSARIAAYCVCSEQDCKDDAVLAAFDDAIADGVDLLTVSLGAGDQRRFHEDPLAIGSFHAMERGILTVNSAGNMGPNIVTFSVAPWLFTVAAATIDRRIIDKVVFGNGLTISGKSINGFSSNGTKLPLIHGKSASTPTCSDKDAESCSCLDSERIKGKIILCGTGYGYSGGLENGAFGSVSVTYKYDAQVVSYPAVSIDPEAYDVALSYANSTTTPYAEILRSQGILNNSAPTVAEFSSRGPNKQILEIMKPDISGPGVEILAAYSPLATPSEDETDKRSVKYNILTGTSMSCPHVAGAAAYVKTFHPDWSPAAIKSSLMTTAKPMNGSEDAEFSYGSGFVDPVRAIYPGLVFDLSKDDYVSLLCTLGYDALKVQQISGDNSTCPSSSAYHMPLPKDFNYPSITTEIAPMKPFMISFRRTVTNVGFTKSTYKASIQQPSGMNITVVPNILKFKSLKEKQAFVVNVGGGKFPDRSVVSSSLLWTDGTHSVRCPIAVSFLEKGY